jgi:DoxX-like protein
MYEIVFSTWLTWLLVAALLGAGLLTLIGRKNWRETYARWSYPEGYRYATGIIYVGAAILIAGPTFRMLGVGLASMMLFLFIVTLIDHQKYIAALSRLGLLGALWVRVLTGAP